MLAKVFSDQFCLVSIQVDMHRIHQLENSIIPDLPEITVDILGIEKLLRGLKVRKATGYDGILVKMLKECSSAVTSILQDSIRHR